MHRPQFQIMSRHFSTIYGNGNLASVGRKIGGKVEENIELGIKDPKAGFTNGCAIRMSYSLNNSGVPISKGVWKTVSGRDHLQYIYRVSDLIKYLHSALGKPDKIARTPTPSNFSGLKGILVFGVRWNDASGHATLWNGTSCSDHCYFPVAQEASIWLLK